MTAPLDRPVLVVDDDASVRRIFVTVLEQAGLGTCEAADGQEALDVIAAMPVSVVLLDSRMPRIDGLGVLQRLRADASTRTLPVILVTGQGDVADRVRGLEAGADDYLVKPVHLEELVARVRAHLRGQAAWLRQIEGFLEERGRIASTLCRLRPDSTPEATGKQICAELVAGHPQGLAAIIAFTGEAAEVIAAEGAAARLLAEDRALPPVVAAALARRAAAGAWIETTGGSSATGLGRVLARARPGPFAIAPLQSFGVVLGVLVLAGGVEAVGRIPHERVDSAQLSAALDYATVASALLAPALQDRKELSLLRQGVRDVISRQAYHPVFQPIIDLREVGSVVGYEALTRFEDGMRPDLRFAEAARLGMGLELERATLRMALDRGRALRGEVWVSLNASPGLLLDGDLDELLAVEDRDIVIELTEHDRIDDYLPLRAAVDRMGPHVRLSIDDAGSGYACLQHVLWLQPAFVKLDRSWTTGIDGDPARQALVAGLAHFARETGCVLVAEGIEQPDELATLRRLGVDLGQGFLLGAPARLR